MNYLTVDECKDGYLYKISARNGHYGVYNEKNNSFTLARTEFGGTFLFDEYHYDTHSRCGTVKPIAEIKKCKLINEKELLYYLIFLEKELS